MVVIGIDLGTTYSCVGVWQKGGVHIISNEENERTIPSTVVLDDQQIYDAKRLIGRSFDDYNVQNDRKNWSFEIIDLDGKPRVKTLLGEYAPEQISAIILTRLKKYAEVFLKEPVKDAVITVPAYFNDNMRNCTKDAAAIAGLNVLRLINEPTAASLAYGLDKTDRPRHIVIFDCGGGTHDVSLLSIDAGFFEVISTAGDTHLGGEDFNARIMAMVRKTHKNVETDYLRYVCEKAKCELSNKDVTVLELDPPITLTRTQFEEICGDLFRETMKPVDRVLTDARMNPRQIDDIVLVGGSTRIPFIQKMIKDKFGKDANRSINPDEAVAYGAAVQAGMLSGVVDQDLLLVDILPISLSIETVGGVSTRVLSRNSTIPRTNTHTFYTHEDNQTTATVCIYEGERPMAIDNHLLGKFDLDGIPPMPRGSVQVEVIFNIDCNGLLNVSAKELASGNNIQVDICNYSDRIDRKDMYKFIQDAEKHWENDKLIRKRNNVRTTLQNLCYGIRNAFKDGEEKIQHISGERRQMCLDKIEEVLEWIDTHLQSDFKEYREKEKSVKEMIEVVFGGK